MLSIRPTMLNGISRSTNMLKITAYCGVGLSLLYVVSAAVSRPHLDIYERFEGEHSGLDSILTVENVSLSWCAAKCSRTTQCFGADYQSHPTRKCDLLGESAGNTTPQQNSTYLCCDCEREQHFTPVYHPNLLGFWPLTKRFMGRDLSIAGVHAMLHEVSFQTSPCWSQVTAATFAGVPESYAELKHDKRLRMSAAFTWTAWVKPFEADMDGPLFSWYHPSMANKLGTHIWAKSSGLYLKLVDRITGPLSQLSSNNTLDINRWNMVGVSYDGSTGNVSMYVNGQVNAEKKLELIALSLSSDYNVYIGSRFHDGSNIDARSFNGSVACIKFYNASTKLENMVFDDPMCGNLNNWTETPF